MTTNRTSAADSGASPFVVDHSVLDRTTRIAGSMFAGGESVVVLMRRGLAWRSRTLSVEPEGGDWAARTAIESGKLLWIEDASLDPRRRDPPPPTQPSHVRAWIAVPIQLRDATRPGALVVAHIDPQPFDANKAARLRDLADFVADEWARDKAAKAQREAEQALSTVQSLFSALAETMPISLVMTDMSLRVIAASRIWREELGLDETPVVGRTLVDISPVYGPFEDPLQQALSGQVVGNVQIATRRPDGARGWVQAQATPWRTAAGELGGLLITTNDITELKVALEAAERSEERLNLALSLAELHVWEIDYVGRKLIKAGAEDTFFERPQTYEDLYKNIYVTIDERDHAGVREAWRRHVEEGEPYCPRYRIARTDGREVWAEGVIRFFADEKGRPLRIVGALRNVTAAKQAELKLVQAIEAAQEANRAKSQFLAVMSHEIRTPLNGVLGMAQAMAADELSDLQRDRLGVIRESGHSLLAILNDVLDISKIEAGKLELEAAPFDIDGIAENARLAFTALADAKGLRLDLEVTPRARGLYLGDATRVRQILYNLISNALKFTSEGAVTVTVSRKRDWLRLQVSDTGIGIAPGDLSRLFEKFEQADASTTRRYGGSGLGLAICRQLADLMGGNVSVRSQLGKGTTFVASLRLEHLGATAAVEASASPEAAQPESRALRILAAEDNEINRLVLKTLLGQIGLSPTVVPDGQAALEAWEAGDWDVILMDVEMPCMDGSEATRAIRARETALGRAHTPIIALTANAMSHQIESYRAAGMDDFVGKPIQVGPLFAALQRAVDPPTAAAPQLAVG